MPSPPAENQSHPVPPESPDQSSIVRALRRFFEQRIAALSGDALPAPYENASAAHLARFLVERTLARAALEEAVLSAPTTESESEADRALRLKVAALTVLRSLDL